MKAYNKSYNVKSRNNTEGSTPEFQIKIILNSGKEINIQDVSDTKFIVDMNNSSSVKSYWVKNNSLYRLLKDISSKNLYKN